MPAFLRAKRLDGYRICGLEQTAQSVPLETARFARRTVLVLGEEKRGLPPEALHEVEQCLEIRQFGVVRSLNVHVSAALAIFTYTQQHLPGL